ncbi:MAG: hypothetical protein R3D00_29400 [Bacteroidia bacterium]
MNSSDKEISMSAFMKMITSEVTNLFSGSDEFTGVSFSMTFNLREISSIDDLSSTEHLFDIRNGNEFGKGVGGFAEIGGLNIALNADYITEKGEWSAGAGGTAAHELGHTGGLIHPSEFDKLPQDDQQWFNPKDPQNVKNFMEWRQVIAKNATQAGYSIDSQDFDKYLNARSRATSGQILSVEQKLEEGELNRQNNFVVRPFPTPSGNPYKRVKIIHKSPRME